MKTAKRFPSKSFSDAKKARDYIKEIYEANTAFLREAFEDFTYGRLGLDKRVSACYPFIRFETKNNARMDSRLSYGFVPKPGVYQTTLTRPDIFDRYYETQIELLLKNHEGKVEVGVSSEAIPIHFALGEDFHLEKDLSQEQIAALPNIFDQPDLSIMDDEIANATYRVKEGEAMPLSLFTAPRVDVSLMRLKHYTGTNSNHFQNYVIFTNYQFYIDEFIKIGQSRVGHDGYTEFIEAAGEKRMPQMPAYHLKRADGSGISMVNIGVGPSNAKTITDHVAVIRPHAWLMLGHCAGLRNSQSLGDYVLAHGYLREDNVLYRDLHPSIPVPALAEIQLSLEQAVSEVTGYNGYELKKIMRTGTVATIDDRNWELRPSVRQNMRFSQSRAIALDMESGTIAANGFRFRVPYGTLLCVSDKPLHGQLKLPGMADTFYRERVEQHLKIGLRTMEILREYGPEKLHSRKLRSFNEVAFQ
ncbi:MAG: AMP nucleosidase [Pseudomonadota bacterium]